MDQEKAITNAIYAAYADAVLVYCQNYIVHDVEHMFRQQKEYTENDTMVFSTT